MILNIGSLTNGGETAPCMGNRPQAAGGRGRPIIYYARYGTCWQPYVKGLTIMTNSIYNGWRFEDVWLDR
jgi:hypothetical protein